MIGVYGQSDEQSNAWFDCEGVSGAVFWPYCKVVKPVREGIESGLTRAEKIAKALKTAAMIFGVAVLGVALFVGVTTWRKRKRKRVRKNPRKKKQSIGNRIFRVVGGGVLAGLGALGYAGPQAAEPISTIVGGGMSLGGLYLIGSGIVGPQQAQKIRKEIRG